MQANQHEINIKEKRMGLTHLSSGTDPMYHENLKSNSLIPKLRKHGS